MRGKFIVLLFFLLLNQKSISQNNLQFERISIEQGLSHSSVFSILQDKNGFLFFATGEGLCRYDGFNFITFRNEPDNPNSLSSSNFGKILEDRKGNLWLATWGAGINKYDPIKSTFTRFLHKIDDSSSISGNRIECVLIDSKGDLWFGTETSGLNKIDGKTGEIKVYKNIRADSKSLPNNEIKNLAEIKINGKVYLFVATDDGLAYQDLDKIDNGFEIIRASAKGLPSNKIRAIAQSKNGLIWIGTRDEGLCSFDFEKNTFEIYKNTPSINGTISDNSISCIFEDSNGTLWIGSYIGGLNKFNKENNSFTVYKNDLKNIKSISSNRIEAIYEDKSKNLWIGTRGGGVCKLSLKAPKFKNYKHNPENTKSLPYSAIRDIEICDDREKELYIATDGYGLAKLDIKSRTFQKIDLFNKNFKKIKAQRIWSLLVVNQKSFLLGSYYNGLYVVNLRDGKYIAENYTFNPDVESSLSNNKVHMIFKDSKKNIWIGTKNGLNKLIKKNNEVIFKRYYFDNEISHKPTDNYVICINEDSSGKLWIGMNNGLVEFDPVEETFAKYFHDKTDTNSLGSNIIQAIHFQKDRNTGEEISWIGTEGSGLNKLDLTKKTFERIGINEGLNSNTVNSIFQDKSGLIWLSTNKGISSYNTINGDIFNYNMNYGLSTLDFIRNSGCQLMNGEIYLGGTSGLVSFYPDKIIRNDFKPNIHITSFQIFNKEVVFDKDIIYKDSVNLNYDQNFITMEFAALDFSNPGNNKFYFKLEGIDSKWIYSDNRRFASYSNLQPGEYIFKIKGSNSEENFNTQEKEIYIVINPPFWKTIWFRILIVLSVMLFIYYLYSLRIKRIKRVNCQLKEVNFSLQNEIKRREKSEKENRKLFESVIQSPTEIIITNAEGKIEYVNPKFIEVTGFLQKEVRGNYPNVFNSSMDIVNNFEVMWNELKRGKVYATEIINIDKFGKKYWEQVVISPITDNNGNNIHYLIIAENIDQRKEMEKNLREAKSVAEKANKLKSEFLIQMSHEIRTPINTILSFVSLVKEDTKKHHNEDIIESFKMIEQGSSRVKRTIDLILDMSQLQAGIFEVEISATDMVNEILEPIFNEYKLRAADKGIGLFFENQLNGNSLIETDNYMVSQIVLNLLDNAIKYTDDGEVKIRYYVRKDNKLCVEINDTGIGISDDFKNSLYTPFIQEEQGYSRKYEGNGLGLSVAKKYCDLLGAELHFESQKEVGSTFSLILPNEIN